MADMAKRFLPLPRRRLRLRSLLIGFATVTFLCLGIGLSQALASERLAEGAALANASSANLVGTRLVDTRLVDTMEPVTPRYQPGQDFYLESCGSCHIALPPAVLPQQTWRVLLTDTRHYGVELEPLPRFNARLVLDYLAIYSRPQQNQRVLPFRVSESTYFQALHPNLDFPQTPTLATCISCHPSAESFSFRDWTLGDSE